MVKSNTSSNSSYCAAFINDGPIVCINNLDNPSLWIYDHRYSIRAIPEEAGGNLSTEKWIQVTNISQNNRIIVGTL
ncbi:MAG: hypothetical protein ACTHJ4_03745 [Candidatus Nucleicultricaceae bacterium]